MSSTRDVFNPAAPRRFLLPDAAPLPENRPRDSSLSQSQFSERTSQAVFDPAVEKFAREIAEAGGRAILVGGFVRDLLLDQPSKDVDLEVYNLDMPELETLLGRFGEVIAVGRAFGVLKVKGYDFDFSVPRRDNKIGRRHQDFRVDFDPNLSFEDAARRRDLTINSIGLDPLTREILDPYDGRADLAAGILRATDRRTFPEDPLRAVRVAQFVARFEMEPDDELRQLCGEADLLDLSPERLWDEFRKLFLKGRRPSLGFRFLEDVGLLRFFPELEAMVDCPQDKIWHPEGTVWVHTLMVVDEAAGMKIGDDDEDLLLLYGALCHDLGKPDTTFADDEGRVRSPNHEAMGVEPTERFLERVRAPKAFTEKVGLLVKHHLAPATFPKQNARPKAYRRLARRLGEANVPLLLLARVARADHFGRTTPDALAREYPAGEEFLKQIQSLAIDHEPTPAAVLGRHLMKRGLKPSPEFRVILEACREVQDESGWSDPDQILEHLIGLGALEKYGLRSSS